MNAFGTVAPFVNALSMPVATLTWFFEGGSMGSAAAIAGSVTACAVAEALTCPRAVVAAVVRSVVEAGAVVAAGSFG